MRRRPLLLLGSRWFALAHPVPFPIREWFCRPPSAADFPSRKKVEKKFDYPLAMQSGI